MNELFINFLQTPNQSKNEIVIDCKDTTATIQEAAAADISIKIDASQNLYVQFEEQETNVNREVPELNISLTDRVNVMLEGNIPIDMINDKLDKQLNELPEVDIRQMTPAQQQQAFIYIDNNGSPSKVRANKILGTRIRTVTEIPEDFQVGDYLFIEKK